MKNVGHVVIHVPHPYTLFGSIFSVNPSIRLSKSLKIASGDLFEFCGAKLPPLTQRWLKLENLQIGYPLQGSFTK